VTFSLFLTRPPLSLRLFLSLFLSHFLSFSLSFSLPCVLSRFPSRITKRVAWRSVCSSVVYNACPAACHATQVWHGTVTNREKMSPFSGGPAKGKQGLFSRKQRQCLCSQKHNVMCRVLQCAMLALFSETETMPLFSFLRNTAPFSEKRNKASFLRKEIKGLFSRKSWTKSLREYGGLFRS